MNQLLRSSPSQLMRLVSLLMPRNSHRAQAGVSCWSGEKAADCEVITLLGAGDHAGVVVGHP
jgi:hypothetical protein